MAPVVTKINKKQHQQERSVKFWRRLKIQAKTANPNSLRGKKYKKNVTTVNLDGECMDSRTKQEYAYIFSELVRNRN